MKLSAYAKRLGLTYTTVWRLWKSGKLNAYQLPTGTIIVNEPQETKLPNKVCIYARVSSSENKESLERQAERLKEYAIARGYQIYKIVKEIGSGVNDNRKQLLKLLIDDNYSKMIIEHKDRLTRFGFNYIDVLFKKSGKQIEVVNDTANDKEDLMYDFVSIITSFCARLYGHRKSKRKTEKIIEALKNDKKV